MSKKKPAAAKPTVAESKAGLEKIDVQAATLIGVIRDEILGIFKNHADWKKMPEAKQRDVAASSESIAKDVVRKAANIIAGRGFKSIHGTIKSVMAKDGLKIVVEASGQSDCRHDLIDSQGGSVTLVLCDTGAFHAQRSEPEIDADEPKLAIEE